MHALESSDDLHPPEELPELRAFAAR